MTLGDVDLNDDSQLTELTNIYNQCAPNYNGPFQRSKEYLQSWIGNLSL